jgi:hypothetical protein
MGAQVAPADQQNVSQPMATAGSLGPINVAVLKATAGATNVYKFNQDFQFVFNRSSCSFRHGGIYALHADLKTALLASAAPMTQL